MAENEQIVVQTNLKTLNYSGKLYVELASIAMLVAELYEKGINIGWETKVLDSMNDSIRDLYNKNG